MQADNDKLIITYYPATKKISFMLSEQGKTVRPTDEHLRKYDKKDVVLRLLGDDFFSDILSPFAGKDKVDVSFRSPRIDYGDFQQMVKKYNKERTHNESEINLLPQQPDEKLISMDEAFKKIKEQGENIVHLLNEYEGKIRNIQCTGEAKARMMDAADDIKKKAEEVKEKLDDFTKDETINICMVGVFDSGKSTLVNALLGYKISPVDIRPETAKMMIIRDAESMQEASISFARNGQKCRLMWDEDQKIYAKTCKTESAYLNAMAKELDLTKGKSIPEQMRDVLKFLNDDTDLDPSIEICFPARLNSSGLKFTIYDTPGADSNVRVHGEILKKALAEQTHSILIFCLLPTSTSGTGNKELIKYLLNEDERGRANKSIDLDNSFFVFNYADASDDDELEKIKNYKLKKDEDDSNPIDLSDRNVFFVSASNAYSVIAKSFNRATEKDTERFEEYEFKVSKGRGRYYRHNHIGKSEYATEAMIKEADAKTENAKDTNYKCYVCSGLYSLKQEILNYGTRYSATVKTTAIIKCMEESSKSIQKKIQDLDSIPQEKVQELRSKIDTEMSRIKGILDSTAEKYGTMPEAGPALSKELDALGVSATSFKDKVITPVDEMLKKKLNRPLAKIIKTTVKEGLKLDIFAEADCIWKAYVGNYEQKRNLSLKERQESFINEFLAKIESDATLSEDTKKRLQSYDAPKIPAFCLEKKIQGEMDSATPTFKKFYETLSSELDSFVKDMSGKSQNSDDSSSKTGIIDKFKKELKKESEQVIDGMHSVAKNPAVFRDKFKQRVKDQLQKDNEELSGQFKDEFSGAIARMCQGVKKEFIENMKNYSEEIKGLDDDKNAFESLRKEFKELVDKVEQSREKLNDVA